MGRADLIIFVGDRVRQARIARGMSQQQVADIFGVSFQQVQKYERGGNRISADKLFVLAERLALPLDYFFPGQRVDASPPAELSARALSVGRDFDRIESADRRSAIARLIAALARSHGD